jgi:cytidine deaminase
MTDRQTLVDAATAARENAYAPYSGFRVGAAVRLRDGRIFAAANVENCSFPLTVCAERNAVAAAVAAGAKPGDVTAIAVVAAAADSLSPCGACRQVLAEFAEGDVPIYVANLADGSSETATVAELLPRAFAATALGLP